MVAVTPGTSGTCTGTTAEAQLQQIITFLRACESNPNKNPNGINGINASHNQNTSVFAGSYDIPATMTINGSGNLVLTATPYLSAHNFSVGTGGTFKSLSPEAYALEVLMFLQQKEADSNSNTNNRNFVTGTYNSDSGKYTGTFSIPCTFALDSGIETVSYSVLEYLQ